MGNGSTTKAKDEVRNTAQSAASAKDAVVGAVKSEVADLATKAADLGTKAADLGTRAADAGSSAADRGSEAARRAQQNAGAGATGSRKKSVLGMVLLAVIAVVVWRAAARRRSN